ncbi:hypothetical protein ROHU_028705 [Labeo rohita]|uniref:Uncharacterized protein n=1 Tax=Labeo rohita TaxID=84645 RepID=A0A498M4N5_LABRO|nr:hypothetical protein ROHU_028705 [Labeo rohita]
MRCQSQAGLMAFGLSDRVHANLLCIDPILVYVPPWRARDHWPARDELLNQCDASRRLALWLLDFLTGGQQRVRINGLWPDARRASLGNSSSEYDHSHALREFSAWRDGAGLQGNISKTKEMAI